jgi:cobalt/nickel transport system permease protein
MHIPDGFLSAPVWLVLDAISLPAVGWAARRAGRGAFEERVPLLGAMGAFVFAAQTVNFPVGLGTSGHLLGGALLALVLGPAAAAAAMTAVLVLQAFLFQDGGVLALGANVFNMALAGVAAGYLPVRLWGRRPAAIVFAGWLSVAVSGTLALAELLASGVTVPLELVWTSLGLFAAAGVVEGVITLAAVRAIERLRPEAFLAPGLARPRAAVLLAALIALAAGALFASANPDSVEFLAARLGLQELPAWVHAPLPDYEVSTAGPSPAARKAAAGFIGLGLVYAVCATGWRRRGAGA